MTQRESAEAEPVGVPLDSLSILMWSRKGVWHFQFVN